MLPDTRIAFLPIVFPKTTSTLFPPLLLSACWSMQLNDEKPPQLEPPAKRCGANTPKLHKIAPAVMMITIAQK
jgi:hypothetical protein